MVTKSRHCVDAPTTFACVRNALLPCLTASALLAPADAEAAKSDALVFGVEKCSAGGKFLAAESNIELATTGEVATGSALAGFVTLVVLVGGDFLMGFWGDSCASLA